MNYYPSSIKAINSPTICFEVDSFIIKTDTTSFFQLTDKRYSHEHAQLIRSEICYRLKASENNEAKMNGRNLNCYLDSQRRSYLASCLNYNECLILVQKGKTRIYYKKTLQEITKVKIKRTGSKLFGKVGRLYIDKTTNKVFFRESVYNHKWWQRQRGCNPWNIS
jgi:hypothetical protein